MDVWLWLMIILIIGVVVVFVILKYLTRDPARRISTYDNIVSPSDGRIIEIIPFDHSNQLTIEKTISKVIAYSERVAKKGFMITIHSKWNDIHYNRMPISGTIHSYKKYEGKNFPIKDTEAILTNRKVEMIIEGKTKIKVINIASNFLSNVKTYVYPGRSLEKGQKYGITSWASQTVIILPDSVNIKVKEGNTVIAGKSVIADYKFASKKEDVRG